MAGGGHGFAVASASLRTKAVNSEVKKNVKKAMGALVWIIFALIDAI
jgi:hypothetical protein